MSAANNADKAETFKRLLIKFKKPNVVSEGTQDFEDFIKLLDLNSQLQVPKLLSVQAWSLLSENQKKERPELTQVVGAETFSSKSGFIAIAQRHGKCVLDDNGKVISLQTLCTVPPPPAVNLANQAQDSIISVTNNAGAPTSSVKEASSHQEKQSSSSQQHISSARPSSSGPMMMPQGVQINTSYQQNSTVSKPPPTAPKQNLPDGGNFGDEMSILNSFNSNLCGSDGLTKEQRYAQQSKMMFDDDGSGNTGIEIVRLNKKFDIFMKRFARAEEDIKEVKQNFYRVMHCAFAKYEQGFKRKNEYLEKRKVKKVGEIERGIEYELQKRGLQGRLEDPLLSDIPRALESDKIKAIGFGKQNGEDSSIGLATLANEEDSHSVKEIENFKKKTMEGAGVKGGQAEVVEIDGDIVGVDPLTKKDKKKILFAGKDKKKKKKKNKSDSEDEKEGNGDSLKSLSSEKEKMTKSSHKVSQVGGDDD